jgi:ATP-dependent RNA helicase DHX29
VLKNLIEKQSSESSSKVKVILMYAFKYLNLYFSFFSLAQLPLYLTTIMIRSATVDSSSFSRYFGHCPVVTAEGRTHPVTTYYLEDIYDQINYRLASDSPASLTYETFPEGQVIYSHLKIIFAELSYNLSDL